MKEYKSIDKFISVNNTKIVGKGLVAANIVKLWNEGYTGKNINVAIIDGGIKRHNDFQNRIIKQLNLTGQAIEDNHGTHVAGIIGANGNFRGGAYECNIIDIMVIGKNGGNIDNLIRGIYMALDNGARVINMSIGTDYLPAEPMNRLKNAMNDAWNRGCVCIAASGNQGNGVCSPDITEYPAGISTALSVGSCDIGPNINDIKISYFSNENNEVDLLAAGTGILSTVNTNDYEIFNGTSMATPHVSALGALFSQMLVEKYPTLNGSRFSSNLMSLLRQNAYKFAQLSCSFGLGFSRYLPNDNVTIPEGDKFYVNGIFEGYKI